ncbi:hypothetical protein KIN20_008386 [Parelaphostrongylus tenuis]|uniref:Uncharacterized protein n=1 Tax=Parelaphostrongylus tenuis TaxID=148309 RepID=A0AAD5M4T0_PARTN|nr:hypothetical protein KIN20_008386 [Parelaphostrongylus tenuis]
MKLDKLNAKFAMHYGKWQLAEENIKYHLVGKIDQVSHFDKLVYRLNREGGGGSEVMDRSDKTKNPLEMDSPEAHTLRASHSDEPPR